MSSRIGGDKRKIAEDYARANQAYTDALVQHKELEKLAQVIDYRIYPRTEINYFEPSY
jgi:hypothetical protein